MVSSDYSMVVTRLKTTRCRHEATLALRSHLERAKRSPIAPTTVAVAASAVTPAAARAGHYGRRGVPLCTRHVFGFQDNYVARQEENYNQII